MSSVPLQFTRVDWFLLSFSMLRSRSNTPPTAEMIFALFPSSVFQIWVSSQGRSASKEAGDLLGLQGRAICSPTPPPSCFTHATQGCARRPGSLGSASLVIFRLQVMRTSPSPRDLCHFPPSTRRFFPRSSLAFSPSN